MFPKEGEWQIHRANFRQVAWSMMAPGSKSSSTSLRAGLRRQKHGSNSFLLVVSRSLLRCLRAWETRGKIWNERKFKHLTETDQIFEFKVEADRILCFFFIGRRLILTHGFRKAGDKTPKREIDRAEACKKDFEGRVKHES